MIINIISSSSIVIIGGGAICISGIHISMIIIDNIVDRIWICISASMSIIRPLGGAASARTLAILYGYCSCQDPTNRHVLSLDYESTPH